LEPRIVHDRHRDQDLAIEIAAPRRRIVADDGDFTAHGLRFFAFRVHRQRTLSFTDILILGWGPVNQPGTCTFGYITSNSIGLLTRHAVKTHHDYNSSHARRARLRRNPVCLVACGRGARPGCIALAARRAFRGPAAGGFAQRRKPARRYRPAGAARMETL